MLAGSATRKLSRPLHFNEKELKIPDKSNRQSAEIQKKI